MKRSEQSRIPVVGENSAVSQLTFGSISLKIVFFFCE